MTGICCIGVGKYTTSGVLRTCACKGEEIIFSFFTALGEDTGGGSSLSVCFGNTL